jgi:hypothetical protein
MNENMSIVVETVHGNIPLDIHNPAFTWRGLVFPPIKSIIVRQGHHAAEISEYQQYNFMIEVTQQTVGMGGALGIGDIEVRRFWVMGNVDKRVDLYIFDVYKGIITKFEKKTEPWGAELDGASTTGWKLGDQPVVTA